MNLVGSSRAKRRAFFAVTTMALATAGIAVTSGVASAHHAEITASAACAEGGGWTVSYTSTAWAGDGSEASRTNPDIAIEASVDGGAASQVGSGAFNAANSFTFGGTFHVDEPASSVDVTARVLGTWGNEAGPGDVRTTTVSLPTGCEPPPASGGCTPGYWKNHTSAWQGYTAGQTVGSVFSGADAYGLSGDSLLSALGYGGGSGADGAARNLLRAGTAALLNASHDAFEYGTSASSVISQVSAALASGDRDTMLNLAASLDAANNAGCPL